MHTSQHPPILVVMGVSGSGKTTIGKMLADRLGWVFAEGDEFHPAANVKKMRAGIALTDKDRQPWLKAVRSWIDEQLKKRQPGVIACSALKHSYQDFLGNERPQVHFIYLYGSRELIAQRLARRRGHFMPSQLLKSQFEALEEPGANQSAIRVDIAPPPGAIIDQIIKQLRSNRLIESIATNLKSSGTSNGEN